MADKDAVEKRLVWVRDKLGNEYVCRVMDLKDPKKVSDDGLKNCIDDALRAISIRDWGKSDHRPDMKLLAGSL